MPAISSTQELKVEPRQSLTMLTTMRAANTVSLSARNHLELVNIDFVGMSGNAVTTFQVVDLQKFFVGQLEIEDVHVFDHAFFMRGLREDDVAFLNVPTQHHLGRSLAVGLGGLGDGLFVEQIVLALSEWAPRLNLDPAGTAVLGYFALLVGGVQFDLVYHRDNWLPTGAE